MDSHTSDHDWVAPGFALADMLARVAAELQQLSHCADNLQDLIGQLLAITGLPRDSRVQQDLQSIDQMIQRLNAMSQLVQALSSASPEDWKLGMQWCRTGRMPGYAERLCGPERTPGQEAENAGECELL